MFICQYGKCVVTLQRIFKVGLKTTRNDFEFLSNRSEVGVWQYRSLCCMTLEQQLLAETNSPKTHHNMLLKSFMGH